jgi:transcriptional regulator with XRE-family HTH domain
MPTRDGPVARATRVAADDQRRVLAELARAQRSAGLSDEDVARACRMSRWTVARIVDGRRRASVVELAAIGATVGRDIRLHAYPAGDPIRDAGQQRLLDRFRARLHPNLEMRTEVPLPIEADLRAWDAVIRGVDWRRPAEAETVLDDIQALERKLALKIRDGRVDGVILVIADTRRNRKALAAAPGSFPEFDRNARRVLSALATGRDPGGSSLVLL